MRNCRRCARPVTGTRCKPCLRATQRAWEKTPSGFLARAYSNMRSRVTGVQKNRAHIYQGLPILDRQDFLDWARGNAEFWRLFRLWTKSGHLHKLAPSVNRIDNDEGYLLGNIEWVTHSINSSLARHQNDAAFARIHAATVAA